MSAAPTVAESFSFAKTSGQKETTAIALATATASSRAASNNRQGAATAFAATAVSSVEQGVVEVFAQSQVTCLKLEAAAWPCVRCAASLSVHTCTVAAFEGRVLSTSPCLWCVLIQQVVGFGPVRFGPVAC